jgi:hypothetical protein
MTGLFDYQLEVRLDHSTPAGRLSTPINSAVECSHGPTVTNRSLKINERRLPRGGLARRNFGPTL